MLQERAVWRKRRLEEVHKVAMKAFRRRQGAGQGFPGGAKANLNDESAFDWRCDDRCPAKTLYGQQRVCEGKAQRLQGGGGNQDGVVSPGAVALTTVAKGEG